MPVAEEDLKQYLHEPISALPPGVSAALGRVAVMLVPYLEKGNGKEGDVVTFEKAGGEPPALVRGGATRPPAGAAVRHPGVEVADTITLSTTP